MCAEDLASRLGAVDDENGDVAELDLVDGAIAVGPLPVGLRRVGADVGDVANDGPAGWAWEEWQASSVAKILVVEKVS